MSSPIKRNNNTRASSSSVAAVAQRVASPRGEADDSSPKIGQSASSASSKRSRRKQKQPRRLTLALAEDEYDMMLAEEEEGGTFKFHPGSTWQEPFVPGMGLLPKDPPQHGLTLYEVHRKPRMDHLLTSSANVEMSDETPPGRSGHGRSRRKTSPGECLDGSNYRITCDYQNLLDEFRCVICFGTLRRTKIVRECLHRFCDSCVQTCLRRMSNSCPVCRTLIPSRRSLTIDPVYDTLIDALGLGDSDDGEDADDMRVDQAMAVAASLDDANNNGSNNNNNNNTPTTSQMNSPSPLQVVIAKKHEMMRLQQQQQREANEMGASAANAPSTENPDAAADGGQTGQQDLDNNNSREPLVPLVKLHLEPHPSEANRLPPLDLPYIRIAGNATVGLLESFVKMKLGMTSSNTILGDDVAESRRDPLYFSKTLWRKPYPRSMQLHQLGAATSAAATPGAAAAATSGAPGNDDGVILHLFYRRKKVMRKEG